MNVDVATLSQFTMDLIASKSAARFASFDYTNAQGERAKYVVMLGVDTAETYRKDLEALEVLMPSLSGVDLTAAQEIFSSLSVSLTKEEDGTPTVNPANTNAETYETIAKGLNVHRQTGEVYINAMLVSKTVITEGTPRKAVNSSAKTIAKRTIEKGLRKSKFRTFKLEGLNVAKLDGETIIFE